MTSWAGDAQGGYILKALRNQGIATEPFRDKVLGMIFEKSSTRTRVSLCAP